MDQASGIFCFYRRLGCGSDMHVKSSSGTVPWRGFSWYYTSLGQVFGDGEIDALVPFKSLFCGFMSDGLVSTAGCWIPHGVCGTHVPGFGHCLMSVLPCPSFKSGQSLSGDLALPPCSARLCDPLGRVPVSVLGPSSSQSESLDRVWGTVFWDILSS